MKSEHNCDTNIFMMKVFRWKFYTLMIFKTLCLQSTAMHFSSRWTPKPTLNVISWEPSSFAITAGPQGHHMTYFPIFFPFDKWYRIRKAKCDEKIHINKRLSRDKDVSLKRIPWWAVILYLFLLSRLNFVSAELGWVKFLLAVTVTAPAKFQIELKVSRWVSARRRLTDIWGFRSNRAAVLSERKIFPKHDPQAQSFRLTMGPVFVCKMGGKKNQDSLRDKSSVL